MIALSARSLAALKGVKFQQSSYAELWQQGSKVATFELVAGNLDTDRTADARRSCSLTGIGYKSLVPVQAIAGTAIQTFGQTGTTFGQKGATFGGYPTDGLKGLVSLGTEVRVFYTIKDFRGNTETINPGRYRLSRIEFIDGSEDAGLTVQVEGYDLSRNLSRAVYTRPLSFAAGTNIATVMQAIVAAKAPSLPFVVTPTNRVVPHVTFGAHTNSSQSPWADVKDLALSIGYELFVDSTGTLRAQPIVDPATQPAVFTFYDGTYGTDANLIKVTQLQDDEDLVNGVIVRGENVSLKKVPYAEVWDDDPASPYRRSLVGEHPHREDSALVSDSGQAQDMANGLFRKLQGLHEQLELECTPVPHLEAGDVVQVRASGIAIDARFVVTRISLPVDFSGPTTITVARRLT